MDADPRRNHCRLGPPSEEQNHESPCYMRAHMHTCACVFFFLYDVLMFLFPQVFVSHVPMFHIVICKYIYIVMCFILVS